MKTLSHSLFMLLISLILVGCSGGFAPNNNSSGIPNFNLVSLSGNPASTFSPTFEISGSIVVGDVVTIYVDSSCTIAYAAGTFTADPTNYGGGFLPDGSYPLYIQILFNSAGAVLSACASTGTTFVVDTTSPSAPSAWNMSSPSNGSLSTDYSPIISASGISGENGSEARIYSDAACGSLLQTDTISGGSFSMTFSYASDGSQSGVKNYYGRIVDEANNQSACTNLSLGYTLDNAAPNVLAGIALTGDATASSSDTTTWSAGSDNGAAGLSHYEMAISTSTSTANIITGGNWQNIGLVTSHSFSGLSLLTATNYYTLLRAVDNLGNTSAIASSAAWQVPAAPTNPVITGVTPPANATYNLADNLDFTVAFDVNVNITGSPRIAITLNSGTVYANYLSGSGSSNIVFRYTVALSDLDNNGIALVSPLQLNGGTIRDASLNDAILTFAPPATGSINVDGVVPSISSVTPPANATYIIGQNLDFVVNFSENITVSGTPRIQITLDSGIVYANYNSGSGSSNLTFRYTVAASHSDINGIVAVSPLQLNGGTLNDAAGNASSLTFTPPTMTSVMVDGLIPTGQSISINAAATYTTAAAVTLTIAGTGAAQMYLTETAGCSSGGSWIAFNTSSPFTLTNLNTTANVYLKLRSVGGNETSCVSDSIIHDNQAPNLATGIMLGNNSTQYYSDATSWNVITDAGPSGVATVEYAVSTTTNSANIIAGGGWFNTSLATTYQITSGITLASVTNYYSLIRATDNAGNTSYTASSAWQIFMAPNQVQNLATASKSYDRIEISWTEPFDNGTAVTDYEIQYKETASGTWLNWNDGVTNDNYEVITGLIDSTSYDFRVRGYNGAWSTWSLVHTDETTINDPFFDPNSYIAINAGGATNSQVVSMDDGNSITLNGSALTTLNKGQVFGFVSSAFDVMEGTGRFFVAGRRGSGAATSKGNMVWSPAAWAGKSFLLNTTRNDPNRVEVYAFEAAFVEIKQGGVTQYSQAIAAGGNYTFVINGYGSYEIISDGYIVAYTYATTIVDPKPLLPPAKDIIGIPSASARLTSGTNGNNYNIYHSSTTINSGTLNAGGIYTINPTGGANLYQSNATRVIASDKMAANSYADSNGNCSAPYLPVTMMRKKYAINVQAEWIALASDKPATVTVYYPGGGSYNVVLTRTGTNPNAPYKGYITANEASGTRFESTDRFAMWYEPLNDTNGSSQDESIMFGWD